MPHLNGIDIHLELFGADDAPRTLFLNGSGSTIEMSRPLLDVYARRLLIACHDQRGLGRTEVPDGPYTMSDYAADGLAVMDHLGWETCRVVGVSFGGMVAQELAVTAPERVERLALVCTSPGGAGGSSYPLHTLPELPEDEQRRVGRLILDTRFTDEWLATHESDRGLADMMATRRAAATSSDADPEAAARRRRGELLQMEARRHHDVWDRLGLITCPTLVASGRYDGIAPPENGEAIARRVPGAELRIYDGGHAFFVQDPRAFPDILDFLAA